MKASATLSPSAAAAVGPVKEESLYEIINGQKVELPPMSIYANRVAGKLFTRLDSHAEMNRLGMAVTEALFILDPARNCRRRPDVAFVSAAKWPLDRPLPESGDWEMVPDLAVEVVSPNDLAQELFAKMHEYFRYGVQQVWIILPIDQEIYLYDSPTKLRVLTAADELDGGPLLPGLRLPVASLFQHQPQTAPTESSAAP